MTTFNRSTTIKQYIAALILFIFTGFIEISAQQNTTSPIAIRVGLYPYTPFTEFDDQGNAQGMVSELISILNDTQTEFVFIPTPVSPKRRYEFYKMHQVDAFFYESLLWGWSDIDILSSIPYQQSGERYIALAQADRDQRFFNDLSQHHIVGVLGYHYGFAGFNSDEAFLRRNFQITLTWDESNMLELLEQKNGDIAVINETHWVQLQKQQPEFTAKFLISDQYDQQYTQSILMRPSLMSQQQLDNLIKNVQAQPAYQQLQQRYGVSSDQ